MPTTTVTITGNVADLVGDAFTGRRVRVLVESSEPLSLGTVSGGVRLNPYYPASIDANGDLSVEVPATTGGSPLYQLRFEGQSGAEMRRETLGWFDMPANDTLEGIRDRTFIPAVVTPTVVADIEAAAALGATNDTATASYVNNSASATSAALARAYAPQITATQGIMRRLAVGTDARILVVTDSTGDATNEWPYLLADHLKAWTANTTRWIPANTDGTGYNAATVLSTGSGSGTTTVYTAALPGRHSTAWQGQALNSLVESTDAHLVIVALGHNDGLFTGDPSALGNPAEAFRMRMLALTESIRQTLPAAAIMVLSQNAWQDGGGDMAAKRDQLRTLAQARGYDFLDIYQAWTETTTTGFYLDNVHPGSTGSQFIAGLVNATFTDRRTTPPRPMPPSLLDLSGPSLIAPLDLPPSGTTPIGWTLANVSAFRNTTQYETTRGYSLRLVAGASAAVSRIFKQVLNSAEVQPYRAKWVTLAVRVRRNSAGVGNRYAGRVSIGDNAGTSQSFLDDYSYGAFTWVFVPHKVSATATGLTVSLYADASTDNSATDPDVSFDRLALFPGLWPAGHAAAPVTADGVWLDYTPTLTNFTAGATIDTARYTVVGKTCRVQFAATVAGAMTGSPNVSLPIPARAASPNTDKYPAGVANAFDTGVARYQGTVVKNSSTTVTVLASPGSWSATVPFTWASGDVIAMSFEYEIE